MQETQGSLLCLPFQLWVLLEDGCSGPYVCVSLLGRMVSLLFCYIETKMNSLSNYTQLQPLVL